MSRNVYTKKLIDGANIDSLNDSRVFKRDGTRITLWSPQELIRIFPDYKIIKDKYLAFGGTDAVLHLENYTYYLENSTSIMVNPLLVEMRGSELICIKLDNGSLNNHRVHFIYKWMIKSIVCRSRVVAQYELHEDIPFLPEVDFNTKDLTPMGFKKIKEGLVWT